MNRSTLLKAVVTAVCVAAIFCFGYFGIYRGYVVPYIEAQAWIQTKSDFSTIKRRSDVLLITPKGSSEQYALVKRKNLEKVESSIKSIFDTHAITLDKSDYDFFGLTPATADYDGVVNLGGWKGQLKGEDGKVLETLEFLDGTRPVDDSATLQILQCDAEKLTAAALLSTGKITDSPCDIRGITNAKWAELRDGHETIFNILAARKKKESDDRQAAEDARRRKIQADNAAAARLAQIAADKEASERKGQEAKLFAEASRAPFPLATAVKLVVQLEDTEKFRAIKLAGDDAIVVTRNSSGDNNGGAEYLARYKSGSLLLVDSMMEQTIFGSQAGFSIKESSNSTAKTGWIKLKIDPKLKEIEGSYTYLTDSSGIECDYTVRSDGTPYNHPKISSIDSSSPASNANLQLGDFVISINGQQTEGLALERIEALLNSARSPITLEIERHYLFSNRDSKRVTFDRKTRSESIHLKTTYGISATDTSVLQRMFLTPDNPSPIARAVPVSSPSRNSPYLAKYTAVIAKENFDNSEGGHIADILRAKGESRENIVKEVILQNRVDYYKYDIRPDGNEPSPWFAALASSERKERAGIYKAYEALPIVVEPSGWKVVVGTKIDVVITPEEIHAHVH